jgi:hypothetical protein
LFRKIQRLGFSGNTLTAKSHLENRHAVRYHP